MKLHKLPSEFQEALPILEKMKQAGFEAYFVGGSVRDAILGRPIHDVDIATSSYPEETKSIFSRTVDIGIEHGTVLVLIGQKEYEITTFRTEEAYVDYRRPSQVSFVRSLEEDLKRRDFTVNAFALNEQAEVIDLFDGLRDLQAKRLRAVGVATERFNEDALRIMRGFRFAASLDFSIEKATLEAMEETAPLLKEISVERIFIEFDKLLQAPYWRNGLALMLETGACDFLPELEGRQTELAQLLEQVQPDYRFSCSEQAWALLFLCLKGVDSKAFLKKWKTSREFQQQVSNLVAIYEYRQTHPADRQLCYRYGKDNLILVEELRQAQGLEGDLARIEELDRSLTIHDSHEIVVKGGDLIRDCSLKPGPQLGLVLKQVEEEIVNGTLDNRREAIMAFVKGILEDE